MAWHAWHGRFSEHDERSRFDVLENLLCVQVNDGEVLLHAQRQVKYIGLVYQWICLGRMDVSISERLMSSPTASSIEK
jgi:hypothetical protein